MDYQVADMTSTSSAYSYYPNYHNHAHLHHHHHMHHNASTDILSNTSLPNHTSTAQLSQAGSSSASLYHEYGISMEPAFYEPESAYFGNHINSSEHFNSSPSAQQTTYPSTPTSTDMHADPSPSHIISSDNGLSYTNLDYIYGQTHPNPLYLSQPDDKSAIQHSYSSNTSATNIESSSLHQTHQTPLWPLHHAIQTTQSSHQATAFLEISTTQSPQMGHLQQMPCISNQTTPNSMQPDIASDLPNNRDFNQSEQRNNSTQPQKSANQQPTYKWMQVKRNVPKPHGR